MSMGGAEGGGVVGVWDGGVVGVVVTRRKKLLSCIWRLHAANCWTDPMIWGTNQQFASNRNGCCKISNFQKNHTLPFLSGSPSGCVYKTFSSRDGHFSFIPSTPATAELQNENLRHRLVRCGWVGIGSAQGAKPTPRESFRFN